MPHCYTTPTHLHILGNLAILTENTALLQGASPAQQACTDELDNRLTPGQTRPPVRPSHSTDTPAGCHTSKAAYQQQAGSNDLTRLTWQSRTWGSPCPTRSTSMVKGGCQTRLTGYSSRPSCTSPGRADFPGAPCCLPPCPCFSAPLPSIPSVPSALPPLSSLSASSPSSCNLHSQGLSLRQDGTSEVGGALRRESHACMAAQHVGTPELV